MKLLTPRRANDKLCQFTVNIDLVLGVPTAIYSCFHFLLLLNLACGILGHDMQMFRYRYVPDILP